MPNDKEGSRAVGVLIYVKKRFRFRTKVVARSTCLGVEYIFVQLSFKSNKVLVGCVYLPNPSKSLLKNLQRELKILVTVYHGLIVVGDFNINVLNPLGLSRCYVEMLNEISLNVVNDSQPTNFVNLSSTLIDHIHYTTDIL